MQKNNLFFALIVLGSSCSKRPQTLLSEWEKKSERSTVVERTLASAPQGQCLKNIYSVDLLKSEVQELEKKYAAAEKVSGTWRHLDLSRIPVPQANFLKKFGDSIGDLKNDSVDYSSCTNVPCIFNAIYGKKNHEAGYVHYLWYLKFGHMLSADNHVDNPVAKSGDDAVEAGKYNGKDIPLANYLYDDRELYAWWRLSFILKSPHTNLEKLTEIQRIPRGERIANLKPGSMTCGRASSTGYIVLSDTCLYLYPDLDSGSFYSAVTHEMSHVVDFKEGNIEKTRLFYRSHQRDYYELAGFDLTKEWIDPKYNLLNKEFRPRDGAKFFNDYAATNPQESFAESIAAFRTEADEAKREIPKPHYDFISANYFFGKYFDKNSLVKNWLEAYSGETATLAFRAVVECSKQQGSEKSVYFSSKDFDFPILPKVLSCISGAAERIEKEIQAKVKMYDPDGCLTLNDKAASLQWELEAKAKLQKDFGRFLREAQKDPNYLARIEAFSNELTDKILAREAYLTCFGEKKPETCYEEELRKLTYEKAASLKLPEAQTQDMTEMYMSYHPYSSTSEDMNSGYKALVSSRLEVIRKEAYSLWESCGEISQDDLKSPLGTSFTIPDGYMVSSYYNCLNDRFQETVQRTVLSFSVDGMKLQHPKEELILGQEVEPKVAEFLRENYLRSREREREDAKDFLALDQGALRKNILANFDWVNDVVDQDAVLKDCKSEGLQVISFQPLFNQKRELFSEYLEKVSCPGIGSTTEFKSWLDKSSTQFREEAHLRLEENIVELAEIRAVDCIRKFPMKTVVEKVKFKKEREACLIDEWPALEKAALDNSAKDPYVKKFRITMDELRSKLEFSRRRIQVRLLKDHFK